MLVELIHQFVVATRPGFILLVDDLLELEPDRLVSDIFAVGRLGAEDKEPTKRENSPGRLNPLVIDGSGDRRDVHSDLVSEYQQYQDATAEDEEEMDEEAME